jgi:dipeptidyl aminopeptidase/acylaminoacyl peptidase
MKWAAELVSCWASWSPTLSPDGSQVAFISDRGGTPEIWVAPVPTDETAGPARVLRLSADPVISVHWSADGQWLGCAVATGGGVRTQIWVVRPDGSGAHHVAGDPEHHALLGPWTRRGHRLVVASPPSTSAQVSHCDLFDPETGHREPVAQGGLVTVLDLSPDERFALLRDGRRGAHFCVTLDRLLDRDHPLLPYPSTGSTENGLLRPAPGLTPSAWTGNDTGNASPALSVYLITDTARPRAALVAVPVGPDGVRGEAGVLAARDDGELELIDSDDAGDVLTLVWNVAGRSVLELLWPATGDRRVVADVPGQVITSCVVARNGTCVILGVDGPHAPQRLWRLDLASLTWRPVTEPPPLPALSLVEPELCEFVSHDGLPLSGWLYRSAGHSTPGSQGVGPGAAMLSFHGGPEAQERPVFSAQHQALAAAGISVFAPNVRGSSGFGRAFAHSDDRYGRFDAIEDVRSCVDYLVEQNLADPARIAVSGRSYGGYLTLAALVAYPDLFAAGVDICGMSDLLTFFRDTEPWIAAAAVTKYGDPAHDEALLHELSPLARIHRVRVPVLVVHGELDTNVPTNEGRQVAAALAALGRPVQYLELTGEGHEYRRRASQLALLNGIGQFLSGHLGIDEWSASNAVG